ncbi:MAG: hypothetical protein CXT72_02550 [Methanobacteriota archaeon]|jgi:hypothetical protein|nr:MAG: hypothetical protein CXT72_02550 [Euryarchaeota archaeon]
MLDGLSQPSTEHVSATSDWYFLFSLRKMILVIITPINDMSQTMIGITSYFSGVKFTKIISNEKIIQIIQVTMVIFVN